METKICSRHGPPAIPIDQFNFHRPGQRRSYCKLCQSRQNNRYVQQRRQIDPEFNEKHKAAGARRSATYRELNRAMARESNRASSSRSVENLTDYYVRSQLSQETGISASGFPIWLVELKRSLIELRRIIRTV